MNRVYSFFGGRHTFFALFFSVTAFVLAFLHRLPHEYVEIMLGLQTLIGVHAAQENYFQKKVDGK